MLALRIPIPSSVRQSTAASESAIEALQTSTFTGPEQQVTLNFVILLLSMLIR
jgi:hypothetical protein